MTETDLYFAESPEKLVQAWGYMHLMLYGKSSLGAKYKRWARALAKARGVTPAFKPEYEKDQADMKRHAFKHWEKK